MPVSNFYSTLTMRNATRTVMTPQLHQQQQQH